VPDYQRDITSRFFVQDRLFAGVAEGRPTPL